VVKKTVERRDAGGARRFKLTITVFTKNEEYREAILSSLGPELAAIDSKRVTLQVKPARDRIEFHLVAGDVTALRAAATSLVRLYGVADGVLRSVTKVNGCSDSERK